MILEKEGLVMRGFGNFFMALTIICIILQIGIMIGSNGPVGKELVSWKTLPLGLAALFTLPGGILLSLDHRLRNNLWPYKKKG